MGYGYSLKDRIADKLKLSKESLTHIGIAVGIAVIIFAIILTAAVPSNADIDRIDTNIATISGILYPISEMGTLATEAQLQGISNKIADHTGNITYLDNRADSTEEQINAVVADLEDIVCSPPEGYLTGTFGNYVLHVRTNEACDFTADIHLAYSTPKAVGNATTYDQAVQAFYASINWTGPAVQDYFCDITYNGTAWGISQVWFNVGTFSLTVHGEMAIDITFSGLNSTYEPDFSYAEVYPVLKNE